MKKNYALVKTFIVLLSLVWVQTIAQPLSGLYTINNGQPTGGSNFQNFTAFAAVINTAGVSGPVTVNVVSNTGPYVEQIEFVQFAGASDVNKVTINGNNNLLTFASTNSNQRYTMGLNGTDYLTVNNLQMEGTGTYAFTCILYNGSNNNVFSSCTFSVPANTNSSNHIPVCISGVGNSYSGTGTSGKNNMWMNCDMFSGYFGFTMYGPTTAGAYTSDNKIINCTVRDFYYYGIYMYYQDRLTIKGNTVEKPTRTTLTSATYGIYATQTTGSLFEGNTVRKLFEQNQTLTGTCYCFYIVGNSNSAYSGDPTTIRNNIVTDIKWNGSIYGFMTYYTKGDLLHNTFAIDHPTSTGGNVYGLYYVTTGAFTVNSANNMVYINKGGSAVKYGIYYSSTSLITSNKNNVWFGSAGTGTNAGYFSGAQNSLANLQSASSQEANTYSMDPVFANIALNDLAPTNVALNNLATPYGVVFDQRNAVRNQLTPDIGAIEFLTPACTGAPGTNTVTAPTYSICPGEMSDLGIINLVPDAGITYQWNVSTVSSVGTWTPISGATGLFYTTPPVNQNSWYQIVMTCTAANNASSAAVGAILVAGSSSSVVPYHEGFEGIGKNNRLPNCSWTATELGGSNLTYTSSNSGNRVPNTGTSFASFSNMNPGTSYFYTNPIQMNTGITYSAALYFATEYFGYNNWTDLSILVGPNQNPTGLIQVASISPALSGPYKLLNNTFTVPFSGQFYVAIRATSASGNAVYLSWDDLSITIPCDSASPNSPTLSVAASNATICAGEAINITATGADTYLWSNGNTTNVVAENPVTSTNYSVYGTNALTGCTSTLTQYITVNPVPVVFAVASQPIVCKGDATSITAYGANSYQWTTGSGNSVITVTPASSGAYTVTGIGVNGCSGTYIQQITVLPTPSIQLAQPQIEACRTDMLSLSANGANTYIWINDLTSQVYQGQTINVPAAGSSNYTVTGTGTNGCLGKNFLSVIVSECTGLSKNSLSAGVRIYPNPTSGILFLELSPLSEKAYSLTDMTGRVLLSGVTTSENASIDMSELAAGVYYLGVRSNGSNDIVKIIKE